MAQFFISKAHIQKYLDKPNISMSDSLFIFVQFFNIPLIKYSILYNFFIFFTLKHEKMLERNINNYNLINLKVYSPIRS